MAFPLPITVSNWPPGDPNAYWTTFWTAAAAIVACGAAIVAIALPLSLPWLLSKLYRPNLKLIVPNEVPDPATLEVNGSTRRCTAFLHLIVRNSASSIVQNASVNLVGIVDGNMKPRDINFKRVFPWSFGQVSNQEFTFKTSFSGTLAIDFLRWNIAQDTSDSFCMGTLEFALLQHQLATSKFAAALGKTYCVLELTGDNYKTREQDLYVISIENKFDPKAAIFQLPLNLYTIANGIDARTTGIAAFTTIALVTDRGLREQILSSAKQSFNL